MKIISDSSESNSQTNPLINSTENKTFSFDKSYENQSFVVFKIGVDFENNLSKSPQLQYQKQSKITVNESNSLPIPWIAAIVINAILVLLFVLFVIYCYFKTKKRRQRVRNPDKDSLFSGKSSKHSEQEVVNDLKKSTNDSTKENIFNIESEHKKLTQNDMQDSVESPVDTSRTTTSMKSPANKVKVVNRLSRGSSSGHHNENHYNPTDSPSVSQYTSQLNDSVPNQSQYLSKYEEEVDQQLQPLSEIEDDNNEDYSQYIETNQRNSDKISLKSIQSSPSKTKTSSPIRQMPSSPSRGMGTSISTASKVMSKVKDIGSHQKQSSPEHRTRSPGSPHSSHHSTAVQTSPNRSWANIPGAVDSERYIDERAISLRGDTEKKYFLYIIKDVNPLTKKECIGRITLPARRMTLEQLRHYLLQSDDEAIRNCAKKRFKFLSESYRLVVMNESFTPVDQIYQTQGIFIKFNVGDSVPFGYKSKNRIRAQNRNAIEDDNSYDKNRLKSESISRFSRNSTLRTTDSIYGSTSRSIQRKDSIYGSVSKTNQKSVFGSNVKTSEKSRFGYERTPNRREERSYAIDRTPRKRDEKELMTISPLSLTTTPMVSPMASPRTRVRLCRKLQLEAQVANGQLEEMPNFFTSSLESMCDNPGCTNRPLLKCLVCTKVSYCGQQCKKEHWSDHRFVCKKPPWKG